ncbi:PREDICTED: protein Njmu-R1-like [Priapulus caudatus]|uniref:Protein Njmu-R1-like n=1 Tax=Priapulus caudatus TaxID=37621 RepID=A0ABM1DQY9_PRICU|nr:PREDICTED: protein Njmu-R1-like [Priapulus caudatus]
MADNDVFRDESGKHVAFKEVPRFHALYAYHTNRPDRHRHASNVSDTVTDNGAACSDPSSQPTVLDFLQQEEVTNRDFSLSVLATDLTADNETDLRGFLAKRFSRGTVYSGTGNVAALDFSISEDSDSPVVCYFCLLRPSHCASSQLETDHEGTVCSQEYIACFITNETGVLDYYRDELGEHCKMLLPMLEAESMDLPQIQEHLSEWYNASVMFASRCVEKLKDGVAYLIHMALLGLKLEIDGDDDKFKSDVKKFIKCCSLSELIQHKSPSSEARGSPEVPPGGSLLPASMDGDGERTVWLSVRDDAAEFSSTECNSFCQKWAEALLKSPSGGAVHVREVIESYKLKTIQNMNIVKRLIRQAENDHYALYRCFIFLQQSGNHDILLEMVRSEQQFTSSVDAKNVVSILGEFLQAVVA